VTPLLARRIPTSLFTNSNEQSGIVIGMAGALEKPSNLFVHWGHL
jgi:hypothetical protein